MKPIEFYDTRTRSQRVFESIEPGRVGIYTCGPTVYAPQHVGNMRSRLLPDLLKRFLQSEGYAVTLVINITDVGHLVADADEGEDKMEAAARTAGQSVEEIAEFYTQSWLEDSAAINCLPPDVNPKATEHIEDQIELAKRLDARGYLYTIEDGVYFDTSLFPRYAELAALDLEGQEEGARIGITKGKKNPSDFAVWKFADPLVRRLQEWDSPWGRGFPGWHLECSAMSVRYLGKHFDIHTAGIDLATVHHSNEVAQTECGFDVHPSVEFWMHNEFLDMGGEKMSKSKGNVKTISDLADRGIDPMAFRYFFMQAHYRQQQNYNAESIESAAKGLRRLQKIGSELERVEGEGSEKVQAPYRQRFRDALADDLNAPRAMAVVWEVARSADLAGVDRRDLLRAFDVVLGLRLADGAAAGDQSEWEQDPEIDGMLAERQAAREAKDWARADRIRDELSARKIEIIDTPDGPRWRRSSDLAEIAKPAKKDSG